MRQEVQALIRVSEDVAGLIDRDRLSKDERLGIVTCIHLLQEKLDPSTSQVDEETPLASPLAHVPLID